MHRINNSAQRQQTSQEHVHVLTGLLTREKPVSEDPRISERTGNAFRLSPKAAGGGPGGHLHRAP